MVQTNPTLIEKTIDGFLSRWLVRTGSYKDFVPANLVWRAMLLAANITSDNKLVWGMNRQEALAVMRESLNITHQVPYYYRPPQPLGLDAPPGYTTHCYERIQLTQHAKDRMANPYAAKVRRRDRRDLK